MRVLIASLGLLLLAFTFVDLLRTTLAKGTGAFSNRLVNVLWRLVVYRRRRLSISGRTLAQTGIVLLLLLFLLWVLLIWFGWTLVFWGAEGALVRAADKVPATFAERAYFAGYTIVTLGLGDFQPQGTLWQLATDVMAGSGLFTMTLFITYLVPVLQAAVHRRRLAIHISGIGTSPLEILLTCWDGEKMQALADHLVSLAPEIALVSQRHLTYPALRYFQGERRAEAFAPSLAALDEALTILEAAGEPLVAEGYRQPVRRAVAELLATMDGQFVQPSATLPPPPDLAPLREAGLPLVSQELFEKALVDLAGRRRLLLALLENEGWDWADVCRAARVQKPEAQA